MMMKITNTIIKSTSNLPNMIEKLSDCLSNFSQLLGKITNLALDGVQLRLLNAVDGLLLFLLLNGIGSRRLQFALGIANPPI